MRKLVVPLWREAGGRKLRCCWVAALHRNSGSRRENEAFVYSRGRRRGQVMKPAFWMPRVGAGVWRSQEVNFTILVKFSLKCESHPDGCGKTQIPHIPFCSQIRQHRMIVKSPDITCFLTTSTSTLCYADTLGIQRRWLNKTSFIIHLSFNPFFVAGFLHQPWQ